MLLAGIVGGFCRSGGYCCNGVLIMAYSAEGSGHSGDLSWIALRQVWPHGQPRQVLLRRHHRRGCFPAGDACRRGGGLTDINGESCIIGSCAVGLVESLRHGTALPHRVVQLHQCPQRAPLQQHSGQGQDGDGGGGGRLSMVQSIPIQPAPPSVVTRAPPPPLPPRVSPVCGFRFHAPPDASAPSHSHVVAAMIIEFHDPCRLPS